MRCLTSLANLPLLIYITHDIDWVSPLHPLSVAKTFTHGSKWLGLNKVIRPHIFTEHIHRLSKFNREHDVKPIWLTGAPLKHTFQKFGLRYTADCSTYRKMLFKLNEEDAEIGLHSVSTEPIAAQVHTLTSLTGKPVKYHRSHYLKYDENSLYRNLQHQGIKTDFSLGHARTVGLPPQTPVITYGTNCVPTILFDNAFFFASVETVLAQFRETLADCIKNNRDAAILFHPENFAVKPALWEYYGEIIRILHSDKPVLFS